VTADRAPAAPASALIDSTLRAALAFAAGWPSPGPPARPAAVAEGVIRTMILTKLRLAPALLAAGLLAAGAVFAGSNPGPASDDPPANAKAKPDDPPAKPKPADKGDAPGAPLVQLVRPQKGGVDRVSGQAVIAEPIQQVDLFPGASGPLTWMDANLGDRVKAGQLLAEVEAPGLALDRDQALLGVEHAEGLLREVEARLMAAKAEAEAGKGVVKQREAEEAGAKAMLDLQEKKHARLKAMLATGAVGQEDLTQQEAQLLAARAQLLAAAAAIENARAVMEVRKGKLIQAEAAIGTAKSNVKLARLGVQKAQLALAQTRVTSPIDGVITQQFNRIGEFVRAGDLAARPLYTVVRVDILRVVVEVAQNDVRLVEPGLPVELTFPALPDVKFAGKVSRVGFAVDPKTGTMRAEIDLPNRDGKIRPGMFGNASIRMKGPAEALRVPTTALIYLKGSQPAVYVYRDGKARLTQVKEVKVTWSESNRGMAEITSGLTADDQVVSDPKGLSGDEVPVRVAPSK
jgi:RND family efflux transporter MFP subunit